MCIQSEWETAICPKNGSQSYKLAIQKPSTTFTGAEQEALFRVTQTLSHGDPRDMANTADHQIQAVQLVLLIDLRCPVIQLDLDLNYGRPIRYSPQDSLIPGEACQGSQITEQEWLIVLYSQILSQLPEAGLRDIMYLASAAILAALLTCVTMRWWRSICSKPVSEAAQCHSNQHVFLLERSSTSAEAEPCRNFITPPCAPSVPLR